MAVLQQSRIVRFESAAKLLDTFGRSKGGKEYRRLVSAFERIFGATIFLGTESSRLPAKVVHRSRFNFLCEAQIWYNHDSAQPPLSDEFANVVVLSEEFYREISEHPIPADLEAVKVLASAPAVLDLFVWLTYRCFSAGRPARIPLFGSFGLASSSAVRRTRDSTIPGDAAALAQYYPCLVAGVPSLNLTRWQLRGR